MSHSQSYCYECGVRTYNYMEHCNSCRLKKASKAFKKRKEKKYAIKKR